jgi:hypothetical protein
MLEATVARSAQRRLPFLLLFLCCSECLYLLIFSLSPLPTLHMYNTPIPAAYPWTLLPLQELLKSTRVASLLHSTWVSPVLLLITILALFAAYSWIIIVIQQQDGSTLPGQRRHNSPIRRLYYDLQSPRWLFFLLGGALLFGLTLLFQPKLFSDDVFTYIFSGRILTVYKADPLNTAPFQYPRDPYLQWVISGHNAPNIYGPLWLCISWLLVSPHAGPALTLLLFKGLALLTHLTNSILVWAILSKIAPTRRFLGTLLYAWNPLALIELTGSGHSEGLLLLLLLLTMWLLAQTTDPWRRIATCFLFGIAISANTIAMLVAPLYIWFDLRTQKHAGSLIWGCCWRAMVILLPAMAISFPFWRGASTFFAITSAIDMAHFVHSPVGVLAKPLQAAFVAVDKALHFPAFLQPLISADITLRATATFVFVLIYTHLFSLVRRTPATIAKMYASSRSDAEMQLPGYDVLLSSCGMAVFWYMILVSGLFWPWYMLWILWAVVLGSLDAFTGTVLVLSGTSLLLYPLRTLVWGPMISYEPALIFGIPLLYLIVVSRRRHKIERTQAIYDRRSQTTQD